MSPPDERDEQVMTLVKRALTLSAAERNGYLRAACNGDEEFFLETSDTLAWHVRMGPFLQNPVIVLEVEEPPFKPGQVINHRFEIVREIGQGGMGIVFEAFDLKRGQRIAIKSAKLGFGRLLPPEFESALTVRHRNICLVNEIHTASTELGDLDFLTMEYLEGPTLQNVLNETERGLPPEEIADIARQICAGLAEAHRNGIVHRDLKPSNIILAKLPDGSRRVVITDFGLAGSPRSEVAGTPMYMAPELWKGAASSPASDIYALGVILHEMVTGATPFDEASELFDPKRVRRPPPVSTRVTNVDKRLDSIIARCLDPKPEARPRNADEVLAALSPPPSRRTLLFAIALLVMLGSPFVYKLFREVFPPAPIRLAILPVEGASEDSAIVNGALNDVADRLVNRKDPPTLVVIRPAQGLAADVRNSREARRVLDATHALQITAVRREGNELVTHGAVIDLATETRLRKIDGRYAMSRAGDLSTALTGAVSLALGLRGPSPEPIAPAASTFYLQGLSHLRRDQHSFDEAIPLFRKAMEIDPHSPKPRAGLVEALVLKNKQTNEARWLVEADQELQAAEALNPDSAAVLLAAGRLHLTRGNHEEALKSYGRFAEHQPRNVEVFLRIAEVHQSQGLRKEAIESYQKAIALEPGYYETYQELGVFYYRSGDYAQAAEQFRNVVARAPRFHPAYTNLGAVLNEMGQDDAAVQALQTSLKIKETGRALNNLAAIKAYQKRDSEAIVYYKKSLALEPSSYICLMNLGDSCRREGLPESRDYYVRGSNLALGALANNPRDGVTRAYVGYLAARLGDHRRGRQEIEQALRFTPSDKVVIRRAVLTYEMLGERDRALHVAETATADLLRELDRHPDLADFRLDPRFRELKAKREKGD